MESLKLALDAVAGSGQVLRAAIIDDDFDTVGIPTFAEWIELQDVLQAESALREEFLERLVSLGHNLSDPPSIDTATQAIRGLKSTPVGEIKTALDSYVRSEHLLNRLQDFLTNLGFSVECSTNRPTFKSGELPYLCLLDYQILPEEESGETAVKFLEYLMDRAEKEKCAPPFVILMSKALSDDDIEKWTKMAETAGFFRFNYGFLNKERFLTSGAYLQYPILHFVKHANLSKAYYLQMNSLVSEAHGIAKRISRRLFQVSPPEARLFKSKVFDQGGSLSEELSDLFAELFSQEIKLSKNVIERMDTLERVITDEGLPVPCRQQRSALHQLYAELLHQDVTGHNNEPSFGDIFDNGSGTFYLILSQECDIAKGGKRERKTDRIIAVEGELKRVSPTKEASEMIVAKPVFIAESDQRLWLWWDLGRPAILPVEQFGDEPRSDSDISVRAYYISEDRARSGRPGNPHQDWIEASDHSKWHQRPGFTSTRSHLKKKWKLRFADAEDIQHQFATRMTRVALNTMPEFIHVHTMQFSHDDSMIEGMSPIYVYQVSDQKKKALVALAPESLGPCTALDNGKFMSAELVEKLSEFITLDSFNKALLDEDIIIVEFNGGFLMSKATGKFRNGKKPWKGLG